jgi:predicted hydrocarbon binding protein/KaiC/GvpD/RAD55 family RecA-like ATPase
MILLVGPPGAGKSTFCHQTVLSNIEARPVIYVTTESAPSKVADSLKQKGLSGVLPHRLGFVDAFNETVGLSTADRHDTVNASSEDLTSMSIAVSRLRERMDENVLLIFDSLTTPYLMSGSQILRFMRTTLLRFAAEGNAVLASVDEGCGKEEDLVAMMSTTDGIVKINREEDKWLFNILKYPKLRPTRIEVPTEPDRGVKPTLVFDPDVMRRFMQSLLQDKATLRQEVGDFVNLFWPNLAHWSCMLWDPKRFPTMIYDFNKEESSMVRESLPYFPWRFRLLTKLAPKSLSKVKDMKKMASRWFSPKAERIGIVEYLEDASKTDEHRFRVYECSDCWGIENVGAAVASHLPPYFVGMCKGLESLKGLERDWNAVETKCIGLGDPYCEWKVMPGEIDELQDSLEKDITVVQRIYDRLMQHLMGFLVEGKPLIERPKLGSHIHLHSVMHIMGFPHVAGERYRMAQRMGGAKAGKEVGEHLIKAGLKEDEAVDRVLNFLEYCKVGKVSMDKTIRMKENCESLRTQLFATKREEPCCFFTTGFLNGLFSVVKNQHVKETKCIVLGDKYCEWEFR